MEHGDWPLAHRLETLHQIPRFQRASAAENRNPPRRHGFTEKGGKATQNLRWNVWDQVRMAAPAKAAARPIIKPGGKAACLPILELISEYFSLILNFY